MRRWFYFATLTLTLLSGSFASAQEPKIDQSPMPLKVVRAFPELRLERPIVLTWDGVHKDQLYIAGQLGKLWRMPNKQDVTANDVELVLDWVEHVTYKDKENEEGLLGFTFHPKFKENGQIFLHYTSADLEPHTSVVARMKMVNGKVDPKSHQEIMRIAQPFWNHNGGQLQFGPEDGYLYIALGDGGKANDPFGNGQNLGTWLGSILRIDVDHHDEGKAYAIPKDNPFVSDKNAQPEIYAYGFRNVWGMHFDRDTKKLWAADVGQDLWEEIDIVVKGGNYGWNLREGFHAFPPGKETPTPKGLIDPIWEYHHSVGKSITGGFVYRGKKLPDLNGWYLYSDYVSGKVWALKYDEKAGKTIANREVATEKPQPYICFGEDADGEAYMTDAFGQIWTFAKH